MCNLSRHSLVSCDTTEKTPRKYAPAARRWVNLRVIYFVVLLITISSGRWSFAQTTPDRAAAEAHINQGIVAMRAGDLENALTQFHEASQLDPRFSQSYVWIGITENQLGRFEEAAASFRSALHLDSTSKSAHYNLALCLIRLKDTDGAVRELEEVVKADPTLVDAQYNLAVLLVEGEHYQQAIIHLEAARKARPQDVGINTLLGRSFIEVGVPYKAIELLLPFKDSDESGKAAYTLGLAYLATNQRARAKQSFQAAVRLKPDDADSHFKLGLLLLQGTPSAENSAGAEELAKAIQIAPHEEQYYLPLASWLLEVDRADSALTLLKHALENVSPTAELYLLLGLSQASVNGTNTAQPTIEKAIALDPHIALAHNVLGYCYFVAGDNERALHSYQTAVGLNQNTPRFQYDTGLLLEKMQRSAEALPYAQQAVKLQPANGSYHYLLGKIYFNLNRDADAIREVETAGRLAPEMDASYYLLARAYKRMGNTEKAQEAFKKVQELKQAANKQSSAGGPSSDEDDRLSPPLLLAKPQLSEEKAKQPQ
jgi:tetratricopeptide (TPR) repeat protein